jgi:NADH:ubiquinone reductase (H+-translocating)
VKGKVCVDEYLQVPSWPGVWALGDCALVPAVRTGGFHPPTAQHAIRQGRVLEQNILAELRGIPKRPFSFKTIGQLASLGRRTGVAQVFGVQFSGFVAWWMWRTIYLMKLPRLEKRLRVALGWTWDLVFSKDLVKFLARRKETVSLPQEEPRDAMMRAAG